MSHYSTRKATPSGKVETLRRRAIRSDKYAGGVL